MRFADAVARVLVERRRWILSGVLLLVAASIIALVTKARFASDILDLLPGHFDSVQTFKKFDREFSQAHELTFVVRDESGTIDLNGFIDHFSEALRSEPWIERVLDRSPMESPQGMEDVPKLAVPLLLNLEPDRFRDAVAKLQPDAIRTRVARLREEVEAGSPKAEFTLEFDPLGVVTPALRPLAGTFSFEQSRPLASDDGTLRLVIATTRVHDLDAHACQAVMRDVDAFLLRLRGTWSDTMPEVLVTGRTAYVAELSRKMRGDVLSTLGTSVLLVTAVFWLGFRSLRPLVAIVHVLLVCCVAAAAVGALVFGELNMVTIGLSAILIGLGVDFGMVLLGLYQAHRDAGHDHREAIAAALRHHASAIIFGALTTAGAFLCLLLSDSPGFMQLGVLIAAGICIAAVLMMTVFFALIGARHQRAGSDPLAAVGAKYVGMAASKPGLLAAIGGAILLITTAFIFVPIGKLEFDANPRSLEPRNSRAGGALRAIQERMPAIGEPILVVLEASDAQERHEQWASLLDSWKPLVASGKLRSVNSPAAFAVSPKRAATNIADLADVDFEAAKSALRDAAEEQGFRPEAIRLGLDALNRLQGVASSGTAELDWHKVLPVDSPWGFVLDRFFGENPLVSLAYVTPERSIREPGGAGELRSTLTVPGIEMHLAGWSYILADLLPWTRSRLLTLTSAIFLLNFALLAVLFRRAAPLILAFLAIALSMAATFGTLKLFGVGLNFFNALAFCLVLGVGVDYTIYIALAARGEHPERELRAIFKPVLLSGLTTIAGFGSLVTAENPALRSLGSVCAIGVAWSMFAAFGFMLPASLWLKRR